MGSSKAQHHTREDILHAALRCFAENGYAAASVQQIVNMADVSKPALYYYFKDKEDLFGALVERAHEERYRLMKEAAERGLTIGDKLEEIIASVFEFSLRNQELTRLAVVTAFAGSGEMPEAGKCQQQGRRNYEFVRSLLEQAQTAGELDSSFTPDQLAMGIYGQLNIYVMVSLLAPDCPLDRPAAKNIVRLFLQGANCKTAATKSGPHTRNARVKSLPGRSRA